MHMPGWNAILHDALSSMTYSRSIAVAASPFTMKNMTKEGILQNSQKFKNAKRHIFPREPLQFFSNWLLFRLVIFCCFPVPGDPPPVADYLPTRADQGRPEPTRADQKTKMADDRRCLHITPSIKKRGATLKFYITKNIKRAHFPCLQECIPSFVKTEWNRCCIALITASNCDNFNCKFYACLVLLVSPPPLVGPQLWWSLDKRGGLPCLAFLVPFFFVQGSPASLIRLHAKGRGSRRGGLLSLISPCPLSSSLSYNSSC